MILLYTENLKTEIEKTRKQFQQEKPKTNTITITAGDPPGCCDISSATGLTSTELKNK